MMKKLLIAGAASLTLLSSFPLMAKDFAGNKNGNHDLHGTVQVDVACMQTAVKKQSADFISAYNTYNQSLTTAFNTRADAQVSAWAKVNVSDRMIALAAAEKAFTSSYNAASRTLNQAKQAIHKNMSDANMRCRVSGSSSSSSVSTSSTSSSPSSHASVACQNLSGKITGAFTIPVSLPDVGRTYTITGSGTLSDIGSVSASGTFHGLGFIASGTATGDVTLTKGDSTLVLHAQGPVQAGFSSLPTSFKYTVQSATGIFASMKNNDGTLSLRLKGETQGSLVLELNGRCDR